MQLNKMKGSYFATVAPATFAKQVSPGNCLPHRLPSLQTADFSSARITATGCILNFRALTS
jgi:hypothetical protein